MDILKKQEDILKKKVCIKEKSIEEAESFVIYLIDANNIVFVGRTKEEIEVYINKKRKSIHATHYSVERVKDSEIDNYMAELIMKIQPIYNNKIPQNTIYISENQAKEQYHLGRREFKSVCRENNPMTFGNQVFMKKNVFDDIFAIEPLHKLMPKIGSTVLVADDNGKLHTHLIPDSYKHFGVSYDENDIPMEPFTTETIPLDERYKQIQEAEQYEYIVKKHIGSSIFKARRFGESEEITLDVSQKGIEWIDALDDYSKEVITKAYFKFFKDAKC